MVKKRGENRTDLDPFMIRGAYGKGAFSFSDTMTQWDVVYFSGIFNTKKGNSIKLKKKVRRPRAQADTLWVKKAEEPCL